MLQRVRAALGRLADSGGLRILSAPDHCESLEGGYSHDVVAFQARLAPEEPARVEQWALRPYVLRLPKATPTPEAVARMRRELRYLARVEAASEQVLASSSAVSLAPIVQSDPDAGLLLMHRVQGVALHRALDLRLSLEELLARWRAFSARLPLPEVSYQPLIDDSFAPRTGDAANTSGKAISGADGWPDTRIARQAAQWAERYAQLDPAAWVPSHNDLNPYNWLWSPDTNRLTVLDWEMAGRCLPGFDLTTLLLGLTREQRLDPARARALLSDHCEAFEAPALETLYWLRELRYALKQRSPTRDVLAQCELAQARLRQLPEAL